MNSASEATKFGSASTTGTKTGEIQAPVLRGNNGNPGSAICPRCRRPLNPNGACDHCAGLTT
ncbi:hypothetical protein H072_1775 [Dactylellina haptotyla CBS 200.50]|uniref:Uncharacterized protein n=1 Tax=Dactylellina haptotyla (strain CBS 200.50) TaxID=1284197 RepID=S8AMW8_DACHA|nr:hypothetical protein H072_1775 [Dactylellina haptotyla CBS 200.50]